MLEAREFFGSSLDDLRAYFGIAVSAKPEIKRERLSGDTQQTEAVRRTAEDFESPEGHTAIPGTLAPQGSTLERQALGQSVKESITSAVDELKAKTGRMERYRSTACQRSGEGGASELRTECRQRCRRRHRSGSDACNVESRSTPSRLRQRTAFARSHAHAWRAAARRSSYRPGSPPSSRALSIEPKPGRRPLLASFTKGSTTGPMRSRTLPTG